MANDPEVSALRRLGAFRVGTRAGNLAEFIEGFSRFTDEDSIFLPVAAPLPVGRRLRLRVTLVDGSTALGGEVEVVESVSDRGGRFGRNGMRVRLLSFGDDVRALHTALLARRAGRAMPPPVPHVPPLPPLAPVPGLGSQVGGPVVAEAAEELLPANPLAALSAATIEHFIDCAIFEDGLEGLGDHDTAVDAALPTFLPEAPVALAVPLAAVPPASLPPAAPPALPTPTAAPSAPTPVALLASGPVRRAFTAPPGPVPMPMATPPPPTAPRGMALDTPFTTRTADVIDTDAVNEAANETAAVARDATAQITGTAPPRQLVLVAAVAGVFLALGTFIAWRSWGRSPAPAAVAVAVAPAPALAAALVPAPLAAAAPAPAPDPAPAPAVAEAARAEPEPVAVAAAEPEPEPIAVAMAAPAPLPDAVTDPAAAPGALCRLTVLTPRPGASVHVGDRDLGLTPVDDAEVDCHGLLVVEHARYARFEQALDLEPGTPGRVEARLVRPTFTLTVRSTPPGAEVSVAGHAVGVTPVRVDLAAFEKTRLDVRLAQHGVFTKTIYLTGAQAVDVPLSRLPLPFLTPRARRSR